ncbi:MAG: hypothetical protein J5800_07725 [Spirochaetales bacterium]|nr:hypothetical protein [Spirochaetales bacterium]
MPKSIRDAYGEALVKYGKDDPRVVVLDADVSASTKTSMFAKACPERFFNVGIAEADMTAMGAGFAATGKIPFINTFAVFLSSIGLIASRTFASYSKLPMKLAGAYGGLSACYEGSSHHSLEDVAIMRSLANVKVFVASDATNADWLVKNAIDDPSPIYLRMSRETFDDIYSPNEKFEAGKGKIVRNGKDATVIACGLMVGNALKAAKLLEAEGIDLRVVDMFCIKPIDKDLIVRCAKETGAIVTAEEHNVFGGLGSAVSEVLCSSGIGLPFSILGIEDVHAESGPYAALQEKYGLDAKSVAARVKEVLKKK